MRKRPGAGSRAYGIASSFGDLTGFVRSEADAFFRTLDLIKVHSTSGGYVEYKFSDKSKVWIRPDGAVVRIPKPQYDEAGRQTNKGARLDQNGNLTNKHNTGEMLRSD